MRFEVIRIFEKYERLKHFRFPPSSFGSTMKNLTATTAVELKRRYVEEWNALLARVESFNKPSTEYHVLLRHVGSEDRELLPGWMCCEILVGLNDSCVAVLCLCVKDRYGNRGRSRDISEVVFARIIFTISYPVKVDWWALLSKSAHAHWACTNCFQCLPKIRITMRNQSKNLNFIVLSLLRWR